ncbi:MAG TPA: hypothetical protein VL197_10875 [Nitrospirota bacterium]|nr:hypothetical protein [Nitrospirota bacterium]
MASTEVRTVHPFAGAREEDLLDQIPNVILDCCRHSVYVAGLERYPLRAAVHAPLDKQVKTPHRHIFLPAM